MALGLPEMGSGSSHDYIKYDARAGRFFRHDRTEGRDIDITDKFMAMLDFRTIEVGWIMFGGAGPSYVLVPVGTKFPPRPEGKEWKAGFKMLVYLPKDLGGGTFEISSTARAFVGKIDHLHNLYEASPEAQSGKLPLVKMEGTEVIETTTPQGTNRNYAPKLAVVGWQKPPAEAKRKPADDFPGDWASDDPRWTPMDAG